MRDRFAPSPTGRLHIGHAYSVLYIWDNICRVNGEFILRIEDIDSERTRESYIKGIFEDLDWLGIEWTYPVLRQSERRKSYSDALQQLIELGICYPCRCSRKDISDALSAPQELDHSSHNVLSPTPVYPGTCRSRPIELTNNNDSIRLNMAKAINILGGAKAVEKLSYKDIGNCYGGEYNLNAQSLIEKHGDIVVARKDIRTSYHLSVVVDDAYQKITHISRGRDLFEATQIHRLLQELLNLHPPVWNHHELIRDIDGQRLAKRNLSRSINSLREKGYTSIDIRRLVGL